MTFDSNSSENSFFHELNQIHMCDKSDTFEAIQEAIMQLWNVVDSLTGIRPSKHQRYRVTIFGSARLETTDPLYLEVRNLASELTMIGCDIVTGGGPGLMQAANEGSVIADPEDHTQSIGVRVDLDTEQETNPFVEKIYRHRTFFSRLHHFVLLSDAFVVVPGGIGTTLEAFMIWQLLQVRQLSHIPLIMVGDMWSELVGWSKRYMVDVEPKFASSMDVKIPVCVNTIQEVVALLKVSQTQWQDTQAHTSSPD